MQNNMELYILLKGAAYFLERGEQTLLAQFQLTIMRYYLLQHVYETPSITPSKLSKKLMCHKSNVTRLIRHLDKEGLILRQQSETNYRTVHLFITERGKERFLLARAAREKQLLEQVAVLAPTEKQHIIQNLRLLYDVFRGDSSANLSTSKLV